MRLTPANFDFFAFGMLGAYLYAQRSRYIQWLGKVELQAALIVAFFLFIFFYNLEFYQTSAYLFAPSLLGCVTTLLMLSLLLRTTALVRILTVSPIIYLAKISYSVYIWHTIVIIQFGALSLNNTAKFFLIAGVTLLVSTVTYYFVEAPFVKRIARVPLN